MKRAFCLMGGVLAISTAACGGLAADDADAGRDASTQVDAHLDTGSTVDTGIDAAPDAALPCGPTTCATGCCLPDGTCNAKPSPASCGAEGSMCLKCAADFQICNKPAPGCSKNSVPKCDSTTCDGCCVFIDKIGYCIAGDHPRACGHDGQACGNCGVGGSCAQQSSGGGVCVGSPAQCNAQTCTGCCVGNVCAVGLQNIACGVQGAVCTDCSAKGQGCKGGGVCGS
ncbi:hypothetical protein BH09MYX1_BH09MYX1_40420 [soil metagenome]